MRSLFLLLVFPCILGAQSAPSLILSPDVITQCSATGLGHTTVTWNSGGVAPVQIRVGPGGASMTGLEPGTGSVQTGDWVSDGLVFVLADATGNELARTAAQVSCNPFADPITAALAGSSYFPLQTGNSWIYRVNSRAATSTYVVWTIPRTERAGSTLWYVLSRSVAGQPASESRYRSDSGGRIYTLDRDGIEQLWLDPTTFRNPSASLQTTQQLTRVHTPAGDFADGIFYQRLGGLDSESGIYVRGIGLVSSATQMLSGSSGGFTQGLELLEARIAGHLIFPAPASSLQLGVETADLDLTGRHVTNCAVPCYFVACSLGGADAPDTWKPCFQAQVHLSGATPAGKADLDLLDPSGQVLYHASQTLRAGDTWFQQIPLYRAPNQPFPAGVYQLRLEAPLTETAPFATSTIPVTIR